MDSHKYHVVMHVAVSHPDRRNGEGEVARYTSFVRNRRGAYFTVASNNTPMNQKIL